MHRVRLGITLCLFTLGQMSPLHAEVKANQLFGAKSKASHQSAAALGTYAKGCLAGGEHLAETGPTWQAMRLSRNRNWGHPATIDFIKKYSRKVAKQPGWKGLYIGDISQPRGGPMTSSHQSHQLGLDIDIWMMPPKSLKLTRGDRENLSSVSVRSGDQRAVSKHWTKTHMEVIKLAAKDPAVDRIFITAPAKVWMCENARGNTKWLQKVRPLWGHHFHFHVRLKCPAGSAGCTPQTPGVADLSKGGNGCDSTLKWWVTDALKPAPPADPNAPKRPRKRGARDYLMADLPSQCTRVLKSK